MTLDDLYEIIQQRKAESPEASYTAKLLNGDIDRVVQKVGEEAVEVVIASKNDDKNLLIGEMSDLYYHLLVLMAAKNITFADISLELERRHDEKTR